MSSNGPHKEYSLRLNRNQISYKESESFYSEVESSANDEFVFENYKSSNFDNTESLLKNDSFVSDDEANMPNLELPEFIEIHNKSLCHLVRKEIVAEKKEAKMYLQQLKEQFFADETRYFSAGINEKTIPVNCNVLTYDFSRLVKAQREAGGQLFDAIVMDPPWMLSSSTPTRGVSILYSMLSDEKIAALPIGSLQENGFLFLWVINNKYELGFDLLEKWGYESSFK